MNNLYKTDKEAVDALHERFQQLRQEIAKVIVGQDETVRNVLISIFSKGHGLLVGVPGLAKTLLVSTIGQVLGLSHNRIQFTPDLMPSDIVGAEILDEKRSFRFIHGPIFANIILADEINRTPPKTQAALLEAMQEHAVTVAGSTYKLDEPFFVLATQNPIEQEGTYPLPEAQLDRFMFNIWLDYPSFAEELQVVKNTTTGRDTLVNTVISKEEILYFQQLVRKIPVTDQLYEYAVNLAVKTRPSAAEAHPLAKEYLTWGAGPRASQYLIIGAKCHAALNGKYSPDREDVNAVARPILRHRVVRNFKAEAEGLRTDDIISRLLS
ncbi:MAG TPA: AAA family ATPase [Bacteroidales bacterium]|nr:MAG: AAA family ATPase [Bacteroidetes bacterium GWE2_42_24]OFY26490.1 MAG: AAA family ATPase [Bacteroidetes bacterium GWF2_43_11]PKP19355.1 MAG: AAA family ATPase [Bacteroidetes bacterium HGW-Bacteroidetes-22]HAQ64274.1 AAA family ATPase [Bacteroidales bacterium]HBZ67699.1 AAA family ATPase [Bacteroidales bacterium]